MTGIFVHVGHCFSFSICTTISFSVCNETISTFTYPSDMDFCAPNSLFAICEIIYYLQFSYGITFSQYFVGSRPNDNFCLDLQKEILLLRSLISVVSGRVITKRSRTSGNSYHFQMPDHYRNSL